jgi:hypothetical protein
MICRVLLFQLVAAVAFTACQVAAQQPRPTVTAAPDAQTAEPSFRDPKTGKVWTPENVGQDGKPVGPDDRAFNPAGQAVENQQVYQQQAKLQVVGTVPINTSPTVPLVEIDGPSLRVQPGARWRMVLYLQNNTASPLSPSLMCRFTNGGKLVLASYVTVPPVMGGQRVGLAFAGPPSWDFVDNASCNVISP